MVALSHSALNASQWFYQATQGQHFTLPRRRFRRRRDLMTPNNYEPFVDAEHAGNFLQLQPRRVLQLARQGKLPAYPVGDGVRKGWRFRLSELTNAMLDSRQRSHVPEEN